MQHHTRRNRPKILYILHLPPPIHGVTMVGDIICRSNLLEEAFDNVFLQIHSSNAISDIGRIRMGKVFRFFWLAIKVASKCVVYRPDLVYFTLTPTKGGFYRDLIVVAVLKLFRVKRIYHLHGKGISNALAGRISKFLYQWAFKDAFVILLSQRLVPDLSGLAPPEKCFFLPNGIRDHASAKNQHRSKKEKNEKPVILYLSNMVVTKGPLLLLESLIELKRSGHDFLGVFAGSWASQQLKCDFHEMVDTNDMAEYIHYIGPKFGDEKDQLFADADIFAFPTCNDTFPLVVLEAMQHGLPVISTYEGGIPDMLANGKTGCLIEKNDIHALTSGLKTLMQDPELRVVLGENARNRYLKRFTVAEFENSLKQILKQCIHSYQVS